MRSSSDASTPADSSARRDASSASWSSDSVVQTLRSRMPVRVRIHSSLVSKKAESSSLVTLRAGSADPVPTMVYATMTCPPSDPPFS